MKTSNALRNSCRGFSLMEVLIGILIFALGIMALAQLQSHLARNSSDSNARTVAVNIAEELIETARVFGQIESGGTLPAYNDIVDGTSTVTREGNVYSITTEVTDYFYQVDEDEFTPDIVSGVGRSDFKLVEITVSWGSGQEFRIDQQNQTSGSLGSGSIQLSDVVSSITSSSGGKVALNATGDGSYAPPVNYNPGQNPDIVSIQLGPNKFKESTTPLPDVIRTDELVETTFDVVTYSQSESGATFLRREEFRAVSCECTLRIADSNTEGGMRPTIWEGYEYTEGEFVSKTYGESANNQQSDYCDLCCRDHHDGGTGEDDVGSDPGRSLYNPFRSGDDYNASGDHKHYNRDRDGNTVLAQSDGDTYVEACRMIRKDGFWRIAQDLRQEGLNSFPADYLDQSGEVDDYSDYVTGAVDAYVTDARAIVNGYELTPPILTAPADMTPAVIFPASTYENPTNFASDGTTAQQLRTRGIYVDYMSDVLRDRIECLEDGDASVDCGVQDVQSALEVIPFYDVQLTWLARWNETPNNNPIDVTNEAIADDNSHDRGMAELKAGFGYSTINAAVHKGNLGLTGTDPIDPWYANEEADYDLYALAVDYSSPPPLSGMVVSGTITSSVGGVKASDTEIVATGAQCDRTNTGFECIIEANANNPRLTVSGYFKRNKVLVACSGDLATNGTEHSGLTASGNWTRFDLPEANLSNVNIVIREDTCD